MKTGYSSKKCGLIGEKLGHSFSKPIHERIASYTYEIKEMFSDTCIKVEKVIYEITKRGNEKLFTSYYCISPSSFSSKSD
jgi:shikimate 5-dehydrogenase